jgi:hypothetical protein
MKGVQESLKRRNIVDLAHWFCWITATGAIIGLIAAIQQLLLHGLQPFLRAALVAVVIGLALAFVYPNIQVRTVGGGTEVALAVNATLPEPTPVGPAPLNCTPLSPTTISPAPTPVESRFAESTLAEPTPLIPAPLNPTTVGSNFKLAESTPIEPAPVGPTPIGLAPRSPAASKPAPINRTPFKPGTVPPGRAESVGLKPTLPAFLPAQQRLFWPSEVAYCPICSSAYSSQGPAFGVKCPHCAERVNLVSNHDYMVHRCGKCGTLYRTTHFPPALAPYLLRYYCSFCKEYHWFPN